MKPRIADSLIADCRSVFMVFYRFCDAMRAGLNVKSVQIKVGYSQPYKMAAAFGMQALGTALVVHLDTQATMERKPTRVSYPESL
jgi:hypothetical protein